MINNSLFKVTFNITLGFNTNAKMKDLDTSIQWGYRYTKALAKPGARKYRAERDSILR